MTRLQNRMHRYIEQYATMERELKPQIVGDFILHYDCSRRERAATLRWLKDTYPTLYGLVRDQCPKLFMEREVALTYTTAPRAYDGFGTEELGIVGTLNGTPLRKVETPVEHVQWQRGRYGSGMHPAYDEAAFLDLLDRPWYIALVEEASHE